MYTYSHYRTALAQASTNFCYRFVQGSKEYGYKPKGSGPRVSDVYEMIIPQAVHLDVAGEPDSPRLLLEYGGYKAFDHLLQFIRQNVVG